MSPQSHPKYTHIYNKTGSVRFLFLFKRKGCDERALCRKFWVNFGSQHSKILVVAQKYSLKSCEKRAKNAKNGALFREIVHKMSPHNPKVVGSNPSSATIKDCTFVYHDKSAVFSHFRTKQVKNAVNQAKMGFGAVNETAPKPIFYFRSRKMAKKSAVLFVSFSSVKTYRLRGSERI